jgi:hypothetical protein
MAAHRDINYPQRILMPNPLFRAKKRGRKINLELTTKEYRKLLNDLEELECIRAFDAAQKSGESPIPFERAVQEIERSRA